MTPDKLKALIKDLEALKDELYNELYKTTRNSSEQRTPIHTPTVDF